MTVWFRIVLGFLAFASGGARHLAAQSAAVTVREVDFERVRDPGGAEWWEAAVELNVEAQGGGAGRFANRVRVGLDLAFQRPVDGRPLEFYRAAVVAPSLEAGRHVFRFYLPPAIVRRDRITGAARFWAGDLAVDGREVEPTATQVAPAFSSASAVLNFREQHSRLSPVNDGVLLPRHLSPWAADFRDPDPVVMRPAATASER